MSNYIMSMTVLPKGPEASWIPLMFFKATSIDGLDSALNTVD